jgi:hypothetical protein
VQARGNGKRKCAARGAQGQWGGGVVQARLTWTRPPPPRARTSASGCTRAAHHAHQHPQSHPSPPPPHPAICSLCCNLCTTAIKSHRFVHWWIAHSGRRPRRATPSRRGVRDLSSHPCPLSFVGTASCNLYPLPAPSHPTPPPILLVESPPISSLLLLCQPRPENPILPSLSSLPPQHRSVDGGRVIKEKESGPEYPVTGALSRQDTRLQLQRPVTPFPLHPNGLV